MHWEVSTEFWEEEAKPGFRVPEREQFLIIGDIEPAREMVWLKWSLKSGDKIWEQVPAIATSVRTPLRGSDLGKRI